MTDTKNASHASIVVSVGAEVREKRALEIASRALCERGDGTACGVCRQCRLVAEGIHPDIIFIDRAIDEKGKQKKEVQVSQIRAMSADAWVLPQDAEQKVYIIREGSYLNVQAQNAALKILEEPPSFAVFIICTDSAEKLLPTVRSRCTIFQTESERQYKDDPLARQYLNLAASGDATQLCTFLVGCEGLDSDRISQLIENIGFLLFRLLRGDDRETKLSRTDAARLLELCHRGEDYLRLNVGVKHVLGLLCVKTI